MRKRMGRPLKYLPLIESIEVDSLYSPAGICDANPGFFEVLAEEERQSVRGNIRHTLALFAKRHDFPPDGDGMVDLKGQRPAKAWLGRRWKDASLPIPDEGKGQ